MILLVVNFKSGYACCLELRDLETAAGFICRNFDNILQVWEI